MSRRSSRRKSPSRKFRRWAQRHPARPPETARCLAPADMVAGYERLSSLTAEQLGPQARILCEGGLYWVQVFPETAPDCLGQHPDYAADRLGDVARHWHAHWDALADERWRQEGGDHSSHYWELAE